MRSSYLIYQDKVCVRDGKLASLEDGVFDVKAQHQVNGISYVSLRAIPKGYVGQGVKMFLAGDQGLEARHVLAAYQWCRWCDLHQFCGRCGYELSKTPEHYEQVCKNCNNIVYPNLAPAIMVIVYDEYRILLGRSPHFSEGLYSALAGYIDMGETAEEAVMREVREEVGLDVQMPTYLGSQSWPYSGAFMLGFAAKYRSGELVRQVEEIEDAQWFCKESLPRLPNSSSLAKVWISRVLDSL